MRLTGECRRHLNADHCAAFCSVGTIGGVQVCSRSSGRSADEALAVRGRAHRAGVVCLVGFQAGSLRCHNGLIASLSARAGGGSRLRGPAIRDLAGLRGPVFAGVAVTQICDSRLVTDSRDSLLNSLVAVALALQEALPERVSSPGLQPPTEGLDWPAGVALQHILEAGIKAEDVLTLVRQVRVRAITDAIAAIDQKADWAICYLVKGAHEPLDDLDSEFWFLTNLH